MWQIIKNEWQFLRRTKLMVGLSVGFAAVLLVAIIMANYQVHNQSLAYHEAKDHLRNQWESIEAMSIAAPSAASFFSKADSSLLAKGSSPLAGSSRR